MLDQEGNSWRMWTEDQQLDTAGQLGTSGSAMNTVKPLPNAGQVHTPGTWCGFNPSFWWWVYVATAVYLLTEVIISSQHSPETLKLLHQSHGLPGLVGILVKAICCWRRALEKGWEHWDLENSWGTRLKGKCILHYVFLTVNMLVPGWWMSICNEKQNEPQLTFLVLTCLRLALV